MQDKTIIDTLKDGPVYRELVCKIHGRTLIPTWTFEGQTYPDPSTAECPKCREERYRREDEERAARYAEVQKESRESGVAKTIAQRIEAADIPEERRSCSFGSFDPDRDTDPAYRQSAHRALTLFEEFANGDWLNLVVIGKTGVGKTHLAVAAMRAAMERDWQQRRTFRWVKESRILREAKAMFGRKDGPTEQDVIDRYSAYDMLVIDEIGKVRSSDYTYQTIEDIIDARAEKRQTVILGNVTPDELKAHFTDGALSRLSFRGKTHAFVGTDARKSEAYR